MSDEMLEQSIIGSTVGTASTLPRVGQVYYLVFELKMI